MEINQLIHFIKESQPKSAMDIQESLLLLCEAIDGTNNQIQASIDKALQDKDYKQSHKLIDYLEAINGVQIQLSSYINELEIDEVTEKDILSEEEKEEVREKKEIPNYSEYAVDSQIAFNLYENMTHKCPAAFEIENVRTVAKQWKDVLLLTCEVLIKKDQERFNSFVNDPAMQGKKVDYISRTGERMRKPVMLSNKEIFIETNLSANSIRNLLVKLLKQYNIKITDYKIYLRADYTDLH